MSPTSAMRELWPFIPPAPRMRNCRRRTGRQRESPKATCGFPSESSISTTFLPTCGRRWIRRSAAHVSNKAYLGKFPQTRMRRNRRAHWTRRMVAENALTAADLIWPVFVVEGTDRREPIASMPGVERLSCDLLLPAVEDAAGLGISAIAIFPFVEPHLKSPQCDEALNPDNLICRAVRAVKSHHPGVGVICDVALDPFNSEGHDGLVKDGKILNDETVEVLCRQ